jgi:hypothetical protein
LFYEEGNMASDEVRGVVGVFPNRKDPEFALKALVEIARLEKDKISVVAWEAEMVTDASLCEFFADNRVEAGDYLVLLESSPTRISQAKTFLKGSDPKKENIFDKSHNNPKIDTGRRVLDISRLGGGGISF